MSKELKLVAIRGATCAENTKESISNATVEMCNKIFSENNLKTEKCCFNAIHTYKRFR